MESHRASAVLSQISKNWTGEPLRTHETILNFIRTTETKTGLHVKAYLDPRDYPRGSKVSDDRLAAFRLTYLDRLPHWNSYPSSENVTLFLLRPTTAKKGFIEGLLERNERRIRASVARCTRNYRVSQALSSSRYGR